MGRRRKGKGRCKEVGGNKGGKWEGNGRALPLASTHRANGVSCPLEKWLKNLKVKTCKKTVLYVYVIF